MTTTSFTFKHSDEAFSVDGTYGRGPKDVFVVTKFLPGAKRLLRASRGGSSGIRMDLVVSAESQEELLVKLRMSFPGLTAFEHSDESRRGEGQ